jgi:hypothetical protein
LPSRLLKTNAITEFGDFQTPLSLARNAVRVLRALAIRPRAILEPTCGRGAFLAAAAAKFPHVRTIVGVDINGEHLDAAASVLRRSRRRVDLLRGDFFRFDWQSLVTKENGPWLIVGNPPWVTNATLGAIASDNVPKKSNLHGARGIDAITGKSNFDISEWMILRYLDWLDGAPGAVAVLCKTMVARKVLRYVWGMDAGLRSARIYKIDSLAHFGAAVDACFLVLELEPRARAACCDVYDSLEALEPIETLRLAHGHIITDIATFDRHRHLLGPDNRYVWRSGIKHDCAKVMELTPIGDRYRNALGELVALEGQFLFPLLKTSDIGNGRSEPRVAVIVTQRRVGEDTDSIRSSAPKTWAYLARHATRFDKRGSAIYRGKPSFSIFGVGPYTFAPWKVAISALYKRLQFVKVGPSHGRPVVFDDTVYFLPCASEDEASFIETLLTSELTHAFFHSMIHWDVKRPITIDILKRLSLRKLASTLGLAATYDRFQRAAETSHV